MSNLIPFSNGGQMASRPARQAAKMINGTALSAQVRAAKSDAEADVTGVKMENATMTTAKGMGDVARVAKLQSDLEMVVPQASGRLAMLADAHAFGHVDLMADDRRTQRRI